MTEPPVATGSPLGELGAPLASSIPEQLPGNEPASGRNGTSSSSASTRYFERHLAVINTTVSNVEHNSH
jgi:hypothetical protein